MYKNLFVGCIREGGRVKGRDETVTRISSKVAIPVFVVLYPRLAKNFWFVYHLVFWPKGE